MILKASKEDAEILTEIALTSKAYWGYSQEQINSWKEDLTVTEEMFDRGYIFKFMDEKTLAGFGILNLQNNDGTSTLEFLFVRPAYIGKRIGVRLLQHALNFAASKGKKVINLEADPFAESFYAKHGFQVIGKSKSAVPNRFLPIMEKELVR